jgi:hypothetical protein
MMRGLASAPAHATVAAIAGAALALSIVACGGGDDSNDTDCPAASRSAPTPQEVLEQEFPDIEEQNAAATVRRFYDVLGKTPKAQEAGNGCILDGRMHNAGNCAEFRKDEMSPEICRLLSKQAINRNYRNLYPQGLPPLRPNRALFVGGLVQTDDPKDGNQRIACLVGVGIFLRQVERDGGFEKAKGAKIVAAEVERNRGTVTVTFSNGKTTSIQLVKEKGGWKFAELAGQTNRTGAN